MAKERLEGGSLGNNFGKVPPDLHFQNPTSLVVNYRKTISWISFSSGVYGSQLIICCLSFSSNDKLRPGRGLTVKVEGTLSTPLL